MTCVSLFIRFSFCSSQLRKCIVGEREHKKFLTLIDRSIIYQCYLIIISETIQAGSSRFRDINIFCMWKINLSKFHLVMPNEFCLYEFYSQSLQDFHPFGVIERTSCLFSH